MATPPNAPEAPISAGTIGAQKTPLRSRAAATPATPAKPAQVPPNTQDRARRMREALMGEGGVITLPGAEPPYRGPYPGPRPGYDPLKEKEEDWQSRHRFGAMPSFPPAPTPRPGERPPQPGPGPFGRIAPRMGYLPPAKGFAPQPTRPQQPPPPPPWRTPPATTVAVRR